jgi:hypothetical protein
MCHLNETSSAHVRLEVCLINIVGKNTVTIGNTATLQQCTGPSSEETTANATKPDFTVWPAVETFRRNDIRNYIVLESMSSRSFYIMH